ncbi:MAG: carboxypeptidase regulatory-like domain-containing protein, partial [Deltaproteobacteria bacterium]|nr:carboxypeptidase regulatory-like domain-containing protein [Deltaproteobacteria bacterium]
MGRCTTVGGPGTTRFFNNLASLGFAFSIALSACDDPVSKTDLNPEGPPEILQVLVMERVIPEGSAVSRVFAQLAFGAHPGIVDEDGTAGVNTAVARSNQKLRIVVDELLIGNNLEEIACNPVMEGTDLVPFWSRVPEGTNPDDIDDCAGPDQSRCTAVCIGPDGPVGVLDEDEDGAADEFRLMASVITLTCDGADIPIDVYQSFYQPSGNQLITAGPMGVDSLGPALVIFPTSGLRTGAECSFTMSPDVKDKDGNQICARAAGNQYDPAADCNPGDVSGVLFSVEPLLVTGNDPANNATNVALTAFGSENATILVQLNAALDPASIGNITLHDDTANADVPACTEPVTVTPCLIFALGGDDPTIIYVTVTGGYVPLTDYTTTVLSGATGVTDLFGGGLAADHSFSFTTREAGGDGDGVTAMATKNSFSRARRAQAPVSRARKETSMLMRNLSAAGLLLLLSLPSTALAQNATTGAISGVVKDSSSGEGLAGVTVVLTSPALQGTQSAITEGSGSYKISSLPPGTYSATYYYSDITVRRNNILVSINKTTPAYVKINTSQAGGEVIVIDDKAPTIDPTSTSQGITLGQEYTRNIPIPGRTFASALGAAPGAAADQYGMSFSGSTSVENSYVVDGVNTTGLAYGDVGSPLINDFVQEIEIITGGYNAEYGRSTGGVVNVVTKQGSNEFHGSVFSHVSPGFLIAEIERTPDESGSIDAEQNLAYLADFGFELGGPIIKDKVWFYVGFAPRLYKANIDKYTKRQTDCRVVGADGNLSECNPAEYGDGTPDEDPDSGFLIFEQLDKERRDREETQYQFISKINYSLSQEHQGHVSIQATPLAGETVTVNGDPGAAMWDYNLLTTDISTKWTSKLNNNKTELEAVLGWHRSRWQADSIDNTYNSSPRENLYFGNLAEWGKLGFESQTTIQGCTDSAAAGDPYPYIENCPDNGVGYRVGGIGYIGDETEERLSARLSATQRIKAMGSHEVKAGLDIEDNHYDDVRQFSGGVTYDVYLGGYNQVYSTRWVKLAPPDDPGGFENICRNNSGFSTDEYACEWVERQPVKTNTLNWSGFVRDSWQPVPNMTFNYGMRYEEQRLRYADDLQDTPDPFTGIMRGKNAMVMNHMWAPRLGALYDWTKEGRSKVYG